MERCVQPRYQRVVLPNFWPSRAKEGSQAQSQETEERSETQNDDVAVDDDDTEKM